MQQIGTKEIENKAWLEGKEKPQGIVQEIKILPCWQMVYVHIRIRPRKCDALNSLELWDTCESPNFDQKSRLTIN